MTQNILPHPRPTAAPPADDPDATVVIGRHRADKTVDTRRAPAAALPRDVAVPRQRWIGRVAAATLSRFRRREARR